ncbi:uncharacterized protein METZ01_LOCUS407238, partial [marine metagenome]
LDDLEVQRSQKLGEFHGTLLNKVFDYLSSTNNASFIFCPTVYCNRFADGKLEDSPYLKGLSDEVSPELSLLWTGRDVINKTITDKDIEELKQVINNPIVIWDNYYANDYCQNRFFIGQYKGRSVRDRNIRGFGVNPTGLVITDSIILEQVNGVSSTEEILKKYGVPKEFFELFPFFEGPFDTKADLKKLGNKDRINELFYSLCIEWKSDLQLEWAPFLWQFFKDLNFYVRHMKGKNKKVLEDWAGQRYSAPLLKILFNERDN